MSAAPEAAHWSRIQERGTAFGLRCALWTYRLLGAWALRFITEFIALYFFLTGREARRASRGYLTKLHGRGGWPRRPTAWDGYRHVRTFAMSYVDRFLAWMDAADVAVDFAEEGPFLDRLRSGTGALFISAHVGNLDMLRGLGAARGLKGLNAVIYSEHVARFQDLLKEINPRYNLDLIHIVDVGPDTAMALEDRIARGEALFIVGDRSPVSANGRTMRVPFLGSEAAFPIGPLFLAHLLQCPVYLFFCVREGRRYRIHLEPFAERFTLPRGNRDEALREGLVRYAAAVEARCLATPLQWFNFYDFWGDDAPAESK